MQTFAELLGDSPAIAVLKDAVGRLLERQTASGRLPPMLLLGETGTGKGLLARALHGAGPRASGPFVDVNCAAIPLGLLEAELFGFERGAFTDARQGKAGLFQTAHHGTLFLDEVGLLPEALQSKLLKAIEERAVRRLGSTRSEPVDVGIVAATNTDLAEAVRERRFRGDLYHRLAVVTLRLPPLRDRGPDVRLLAEHFLTRACRDYKLPLKTLTPDAETALLTYSWPGNVRELVNVMERVALLSEGRRVSAEALDLPAHAADEERVPGHREAIPLDEALGTVERSHLIRALQETGWNFTQAAKRLGIPRNTLRYRVEKYGLTPGTAPAASPSTSTAAGRELSSDVEVRESSEHGIRGQLRWERRIMTALRAQLGPGPAAGPGAANRTLSLVLDKLGTFGGRVEELSEQGVLVLFGLEPVEDAPRRAAHAAMAAQRAAEELRGSTTPGLPPRIGIHVGEFLVGRLGRDFKLDRDAKLDLLRVMEGAVERAAPGEIVVTGAAAPFLERRFDLQAPPDEQEEGRVFLRLAGRERTGFELGGRMLRFVGRGRELDVLHSLWSMAVSGKGQLVGIVGEPGTGKSRLLFEFRRLVADAHASWSDVSCLSYAKSMPLLPVVDLLRRYFEVEDEDGPREIREKVEGKTGILGGGVLARARPPLLSLLDALPEGDVFATLPPPQRREQMLEAVRRLLLAESQVRPILLVVEDLQWIDPETQVVLDALVGSLPAARLLLAVAYRPEYRHGWAGLSYYSQLPVGPLPPLSAAELLEELLGDDPRLGPAKELLLATTGGHPFFLEETVRMLAEEKVLTGRLGAYRLAMHLDRVHAPPTVRAVLGERVDRLPVPQRRLLQCASVIGQDVGGDLLRVVAGYTTDARFDQDLAALRAAELLYETQVVEPATYRFKHVLTQEVVYESLFADERRALHARLVGAIEALRPNRLTEYAEVLAHHAVSGEVWDRAVDYLREAGAKAYARGAVEESVERYRRALALIERLPRSAQTAQRAIDVRLDLHAPLLVLGRTAEIPELYPEAERLARQIDDPARLGQVLQRVGQIAWLGGRYRASVECTEQALAVARTVDDVRTRVQASYYLGLNRHALGQYHEAIRHFSSFLAEPDVEVAKRLVSLTVSQYVAGNVWLAYALAATGEFERADACLEQAMQSAEETDHAQARVITATLSAIVRTHQGEAGRCIGWHDRIVGACERIRFLIWLPGAYSTWGWVLARAGQPAAGLPYLERAVAVNEQTGARTFHAQRYAWWAEGLVLAGRIAEARRRVDTAIELAQAMEERGILAEALRIRAMVAMAENPPTFPEAADWYRRGLALSEELGLRPLASHCALGLGRVLEQAGEVESARRHVDGAQAVFRELGMTPWWEPPAPAG